MTGPQGVPPSVQPSGQQNKPSVEVKKYYQPYAASAFILKDGTRLVFVNGCLETSDKEAIDEIEAAIKSGAEIFREPMNVIKSDAQKMRVVGAGGHAAAASGTGMANSATIAQLAAESNGSVTK